MDKTMGPVIIDIEGLCLTDEDKALLEHPSLGGVIFFARNYESPKQLESLISEIHATRPNCFIGVDQEGGRVQRFTEGFSKLPNMNDLGLLMDDERFSENEILNYSEKLGYIMAFELISLGVDMSFAPVLDLATDLNPVVRQRAIHSDPFIVTQVALTFIKGMNQAGMAACGKHFPGHGQAKVDSHLSLPEDERILTDLETDLKPFANLIQQGLQAIMPGHLLFPNIDNMPSIFSKFWLQNILRERLKFNGTIVSDDLNMEASRSIGCISDCAQLSLDAGCDFILVCNNRPEAIKVLDSTQPKFDPLSVQRRNALKAQKTNIQFENLAQNALWQEAQAVMGHFKDIAAN